MLRACTASLTHSNAALFVNLNKIQVTSNRKKARKSKTCLSECIHFHVGFPFPTYGILGGEQGYERKLVLWVVWSRACGIPQETSISRWQTCCSVQTFDLCSASLKLLFWSSVCCSRVDALLGVRHPGQMMDSPDGGVSCGGKDLMNSLHCV